MAVCEHCQAELKGCRRRFPDRELGDWHLFPSERAMLDLMYRRQGMWITADMFYALLDRESHKATRVRVSHLRKALRGTPWRIECNWQGAYRLIEDLNHWSVKLCELLLSPPR
jgi:hypothetical protein